MPSKCKNFLIYLLCWLTIYITMVLLYFARQKYGSSLSYHQQQRRFKAFNIISDYLCKCEHSNARVVEERSASTFSTANNVTRRILIIIDPQTTTEKSILNFFNYFKLPIRIEEHSPGDYLFFEINGTERFSLIIFENYQTYHLLSKKEKEYLHNFCRNYSIGVISFLQFEPNSQLHFQEFTAYGGQLIKQLEFVDELPVNKRRIGKSGCIHSVQHKRRLASSLFQPKTITSSTLLRATSEANMTGSMALLLPNNQIIFGAKPDDHWMVKITLLDAIHMIAPSVHNEDFQRFIQIDIDDIFVGAPGSRFAAEDVYQLIQAQENLRKNVEDFKFTLGFSGYFFRHGDSIEVRADELLISHANQFHWFPHMWRHNHANEYSFDYLMALMAQNKVFSNNMDIFTNLSYAVSPQHSGVYPVYKPLYDAWKKIWSTRVTSTEEYPHLKPDFLRRGFIYSDINVLPRFCTFCYKNCAIFSG